MAWIISMPRVDPAMEKGIIAKILKNKGERVRKGETILKIITEKATFEVNSPYEGYITKIFHNEGEEIPVGEPILEISETFEIKEEILATPAARRLAREYNIDLSKIKGSGPGGRITQEDVIKYVQETKQKEKILQISPLRKIIIDKVKESNLIPQVTLNMDVDVSKLLLHREKSQFSFDTYFIYSCSKALKEFPLLNSEFTDKGIVIKDEINISFAFDYNNELYMLVIKNADKKNLGDIEKDHNLLIEKVKKGNLSLEDVKDSTFSITNLGAFNVRYFNPLIYPPNTGILGIGSLHYDFIYKENHLEIKPIITLSLTFDHRVVDGVYASKFLQKIKQIIEEGNFE